MMLFESPWAFLLFIPLILVVLYATFIKSKKEAALQFSDLSTLKSVPRSLKMRLAFVPLGVKVMSLVLAIVALARPQHADQQIRRDVEGVDIMIVLDISDSMVIEDMPPFKNRMDSAKETIKRFIKARISDRIGFIVFSGESFTRVPLTLDYDLLLKTVEDTDSTRNIKMGTAIGVGLANGVYRLKESTAKSKILIFLTDGENNSGTIDPETGLEIAKGYGIKIYSIGIGRDGDTKIPVVTTDPFGNRIKRYQPFFSAVNEDLLQKMATETGGKYYRATSGDKLASFFEEIDRLEKTKVEVNKYTKKTELFQLYLKWSLALLILGVLLDYFWLRRFP